MKKQPLTPTEERAELYLRQYQADNDRMPTLLEIGLELGYKMSSAKQNALFIRNSLQRKGYIEVGPGWRNIKIIN